MAVNRNLDVAKIKWVEWENRHGELKAHAVDPESKQRTGVERTLTGAIIPAGAKPAKTDTARDVFSQQVIERIQAQQGERAAADEAKSAAREAKAAEKAAKAQERATAAAEKAAAKNAAAAVKAQEKAAAAAEKATAKVAAASEAKVARTEAAAKSQGLKRKGDQYLVLSNGKPVGSFEAKLFDLSGGPPTIAVTDKIWVVSQKNKKIAQGKIPVQGVNSAPTA